MRAIRTRTHSYILNLAHPLDYPIAGDVAGSPSWRAIAADPSTHLGQRTQAAYRHRPAEELYDLERDPDELVNLAASPTLLGVKSQLAERLRMMRVDTKDPWLEGLTDPYRHAKAT
jgi:N-sulfoglucosamine sulfohydrolase